VASFSLFLHLLLQEEERELLNQGEQATQLQAEGTENTTFTSDRELLNQGEQATQLQAEGTENTTFTSDRVAASDSDV
jgi:hypothetical protein